LYKINKNNTDISASNLVGKKDISLFSIVSRETFANLLINNDVNDLNSTNNNYSSFSHGNNLNAMMGLGSNGSNMTKSRHIEKSISK
jgi:hypothetical protein